MKSATAIIGGNYGDEGKGRTVDYLVSQHRSPEKVLVVRHNGGAQAGHTVSVSGNRFVFSHLGSGTLLGAPTYLSQHFIVNPIMFLREVKNWPSPPVVYTHSHCYVTTPYDIMLNQMKETHRGENKTGSCGLGINETMKRSAVIGLDPIIALDLKDKDELVWGLKQAREYAVALTQPYGEIGEETRKLITNQDIADVFIEDCLEMAARVEIIPFNFLEPWCSGWSGNILFEGAQGLGLDRTRGHFPYVTNSHTGIKNVVELSKEFGLSRLNVLYITRPYLTRHGAGPMESEHTEFTPQDETNVYNKHQGSLRYGWLDIDAMNRRMASDKEDLAGSHLTHSSGIALTCLDQLDYDNFWVLYKGSTVKVKSFHKLFLLLDPKGTQLKYISIGEDRNNMFKLP